MILGYRAEYLARAHMPGGKPILILCYNEPLSVKLGSRLQARGLSDRVQARHFHKGCRQQLVSFGQDIPPQGPDMFNEMVQGVIRAVDRRQIPGGQYQAILTAGATWPSCAAAMRCRMRAPPHWRAGSCPTSCAGPPAASTLAPIPSS